MDPQAAVPVLQVRWDEELDRVTGHLASTGTDSGTSATRCSPGIVSLTAQTVIADSGMGSLIFVPAEVV